MYYGMHPLFKKAFEYLCSSDFTKIENGSYELDGKNLIAIVNSYQTEPSAQRVWEGHQKYIDIQLVSKGIENMGYSPIHLAKELQAYNDENDFTKFDASGLEITVPAGYFTIFYPTDIHKPNLIHTSSTEVKKVVMKVRVSEPRFNLTFASNNVDKLEEIKRKLLGTSIGILGLKESGINEELSETGDTLEANAFEKANRVYSKYGLNCFADDTGLEVEALDGAPGVFSARYAGEKVSYDDNVKKLLYEMKDISNRNARFRTIVCLIMDATEYRFEGIVNGFITENPKGTQGFGYDPVFVPDGYDITFAEMDVHLKNQISHRGRAIEKLVRFLKENIL